MKAVLFFTALFASALCGPIGFASPDNLGLNLCPTCVSFMNTAVQELVQIIVNGGVLGSCSALCGQLPNSLEATACNLICDYVGIEGFIKVLDAADPDPIFYCEEFDICPIATNAAANITYLAVSPSSGPAGTTFNINVQYDVTSPIGTGSIAFVITPPGNSGAEPFGDEGLIVSQPNGRYSGSLQLEATPSEQEPFSSGLYQVDVFVCEGTCGSIHKWSYQLSHRHSSFTIQ